MIKSISKLPRRKVTVDELLDLDNKNEVIAYLDENKDKIYNLCCIIEWKDGNIETRSSQISIIDAVWLLDVSKQTLINKWLAD